MHTIWYADCGAVNLYLILMCTCRVYLISRCNTVITQECNTILCTLSAFILQTSFMIFTFVGSHQNFEIKSNELKMKQFFDAVNYLAEKSLHKCSEIYNILL